MAFDDLPGADVPNIPVINPPTPPATETRNVLDGQSNIIGTLTLLAGTSEAIWAALLLFYSTQPAASIVGFKEYSAAVSTNTSSANYVQINALISDPLDAGTYLVTVTANVSTTAPLLSNPGFLLGLFAGGVQVPNAEVSDVSGSLSLFSISPITMTFNKMVTVTSGQTIDVRWKTNGAGNTITCTNRVLDIVRMK